MKKFILLALALAISYSLSIDHQQVAVTTTSTPVGAGGWSASTVDSNIDQYIRQQFPSLSGATLTSTKSQIVAGTNYEYTYQKGNTEWIITVFDQSWTNTRQVTSVQKIIQANDANGNAVENTVSTQLESRDFTTIARTKFTN